jgi:LuxR family maltose regulon positive regulatory protein
LVRRLLQTAESGGRGGSVVELLVLEVQCHEMRGDRPAALVPLARARTLAEPEGFVRVFVEAGFDDRVVRRARLPEPLSERELDVLRLLATDLNGPEIASALVVSLNTVRTHTRNIYTKLGVNTRRAAVRRAAELDLT